MAHLQFRRRSDWVKKADLISATARFGANPLLCSADILVCGFAGHSCPVFPRRENGDWKVGRTRRLESLRYSITVIARRILEPSSSAGALEITSS